MGSAAAAEGRKPRFGRRESLRLVLPLLGAGTVLFACGGAPPAGPPNLVLITLDTTRADRLGCYGGPDDVSPHLDAFARSATVYENAYATSSWTLPSHASLFTGLFPSQHGAQSLPGAERHGLGYGVRPLAPEFETLAERLREAGYRTAAVVAGPALRAELGVAQGFEIYHDELDTPGRRFHGKRASEVMDQVEAVLAQIGGEPFFLFVNFFDPHAPYQPPGYRSAEAPPPKDLVPRLLDLLREGRPPVPASALPDDIRSALAASLHAYDAEIRYMDEHLGRLLARLDDLGGDRGTAIVITSDHGESFGEHYFVSHGAHLYEDNTRVPLVVRKPGQRRGRRVETPVQNHRATATLLTLAGLDPLPGSVPPLGQPKTRIITEVHRSELNVALFGEVLDRDLVAIYDPPFKAIFSTRRTAELFDLDSDPEELHDLAEARAERLETLADQLERWRKDHPLLSTADEPAELRPETEEALRALGYLE